MPVHWSLWYRYSRFGCALPARGLSHVRRHSLQMALRSTENTSTDATCVVPVRRQLFAELDADNDGTLDAGELQVGCNAIGCVHMPDACQLSHMLAAFMQSSAHEMAMSARCQQGALKKLGLPRSPEYVDQLMTQFGRNGSGKVTHPLPTKSQLTEWMSGTRCSTCCAADGRGVDSGDGCAGGRGGLLPVCGAEGGDDLAVVPGPGPRRHGRGGRRGAAAGAQVCSLSHWGVCMCRDSIHIRCGNLHIGC